MDRGEIGVGIQAAFVHDYPHVDRNAMVCSTCECGVDVGLSTPSNWSNDCRVQRPLPEGWKQVEPPDGSKTYYYNVKTRQTTWDRPDKDPFALPTEVFLQFTSDELTHL